MNKCFALFRFLNMHYVLNYFQFPSLLCWMGLEEIWMTSFIRWAPAWRFAARWDNMFTAIISYNQTWELLRTQFVNLRQSILKFIHFVYELGKDIIARFFSVYNYLNLRVFWGYSKLCFHIQYLVGTKLANCLRISQVDCNPTVNSFTGLFGHFKLIFWNYLESPGMTGASAVRSLKSFALQLLR